MPSPPLFGSKLGQSVYNVVFKRTWTYTIFVLGGAYVGERLFNNTMEALWRSNNKGKFFEDIKIPAAAEE